MDDRLEHDLRLKYGLTEDPDGALIAVWAVRVAQLTASGVDAEQAGRKASLEVFGELEGILYFSQADTIEALLMRAAAK